MMQFINSGLRIIGVKGLPHTETDILHKQENDLAYAQRELNIITRQRGELACQLAEIQKKNEALIAREEKYRAEVATLTPLIAEGKKKQEAEAKKRKAERQKKTKAKQAEGAIQAKEYKMQIEAQRQRRKELEAKLAEGERPTLDSDD